MFVTYRFLAMSAAMCLFFFMAFPVMAQEGQQQRGQPGDTESHSQISDAELEKAAEAYAKIQRISDKFQRSLQQTQNPDERLQLQREANEQMVQAVENAGLEVERYNNIMAQVRGNDKVRERFTKKMQEAR